MKQTIFLILMSLSLWQKLSGQSVAINTTGASPAPSAILDVSSTSKGILIPRMTTMQRAGITSPAVGLIVYDTNLNKLYCYTGSAWVEMLSGYVTLIRDSDNDTKIQVEESVDEDKIRFDLGGAERWVMTSARLEPKNTGGSVFIGRDAGLMDNGAEKNNVAMGASALAANTVASGLVAVGDSALAHNGIESPFLAINNTAVGSRALRSNTTGYNNTAQGFLALYSNTGGVDNTALGTRALVANSIGAQNSAVGSGALLYNTEGVGNSALGYETLWQNTTGNDNTALGSMSANANTTGSSNTAVGIAALAQNTTGSTNVAIGAFALLKNTDRSHLVAIGDSALLHNGTDALESYEASGNTAIGSRSLYANTTGYYNTAMGMSALDSNTIGYLNTAFGWHALQSNTSGFSNTAFGPNALLSNTSGHSNTAHGINSLYSNTSGTANTAIGNTALFFNTTGHNNVAQGYNAMKNNTTGNCNVAIGQQALYTNVNRSDLVAIGDSALLNNGLNVSQTYHATGNTAVGARALYLNTTGWANTAQGYQALDSNTAGWQNSAFGYKALNSLTSGIENTAIGYLADVVFVDHVQGAAIGANALCNADHKVRIGSSTVEVIEGQVDWYFPSDARFKFNIHDDNIPGLAFVNQLRPVSYQFDTRKYEAHLMQHMMEDARESRMAQQDYRESTARIQTGFLAQEVEQLCNDLNFSFSGLHVPTNDTDNYSLAYGSFVPLLVKAIQEQQSMIEELEITVGQQQAKIKTLTDEVASLRQKL